MVREWRSGTDTREQRGAQEAVGAAVWPEPRRPGYRSVLYLASWTPGPSRPLPNAASLLRKAHDRQQAAEREVASPRSGPPVKRSTGRWRAADLLPRASILVTAASNFSARIALCPGAARAARVIAPIRYGARSAAAPRRVPTAGVRGRTCADRRSSSRRRWRGAPPL